ncbi:IS30 family transposase, partial [Candidatus Erwinia dacicola]|nr:IS30 family transposase [Candidatus Erwinia dacicola]
MEWIFIRCAPGNPKYASTSASASSIISVNAGKFFSSWAEIGRRLGVCKSTVSRELRRNRSVDSYQPAVAQKLSTSRRKAAGKRRMHEDTVFFVEAALNWLWSPEQISAVGDIIGRPVSHEWIYQHVSGDKVQGGKLYKLLRQGKRRYRYRKGYGKKEVRYLTPYLSSRDPPWLMNAAG